MDPNGWRTPETFRHRRVDRHGSGHPWHHFAWPLATLLEQAAVRSLLQLLGDGLGEQPSIAVGVADFDDLHRDFSTSDGLEVTLELLDFDTLGPMTKPGRAVFKMTEFSRVRSITMSATAARRGPVQYDRGTSESCSPQPRAQQRAPWGVPTRLVGLGDANAESEGMGLLSHGSGLLNRNGDRLGKHEMQVAQCFLMWGRRDPWGGCFMVGPSSTRTSNTSRDESASCSSAFAIAP